MDKRNEEPRVRRAIPKEHAWEARECRDGLDREQAQQASGPRRQGRNHLCTAPGIDGAAPGEAQDQARHRAGHQSNPGPVELAHDAPNREARPPHSHEKCRHEERDVANGKPQVKVPAPGGMLAERTADHRPDARAKRVGHVDHAVVRAVPRERNNVRHDYLGQHDQPTGSEPLDRTAGQHGGQIGARRRDETPDPEQGVRQEQHALPSKAI